MDEIKDTERTDSVSRFMDAQNVRTNPFGDNRAGERAYRRAERIASALYLLTNHIAPEETIRSSVRTESNNLLEYILALRNEMRVPESRHLQSLQSTIRHLISLVRILTVSGFVSIQNGNTMVDALDELGNFVLVSQRSALSESVSISREDLLDVDGGALPLHKIEKDLIKDKAPKQRQVTVSNTAHRSAGAQEKSEIGVRAQSIIAVLRAGGTLGIKDICTSLPEYSEKMIQRELLELVAEGSVHKTGLKRWSRYSVA